MSSYFWLYAYYSIVCWLVGLICRYSRDASLRTLTMTTAERTLSGQSRWVWLRLGINYVTIGIGRVYDVDSILATFYEPALKPVNFMAVYGLSITCQFLIPYQLYNGNYYTIRYDTIRDAILTCARKPT